MMNTKEQRKELMEEMQFGMVLKNDLTDPWSGQKMCPGDLVEIKDGDLDDYFRISSIKNVFSQFGEGGFFACIHPQNSVDLQQWKEWAKTLTPEISANHIVLLSSKVRVGTILNIAEPKVIKLMLDAGADITTENYRLIRMSYMYYPAIFQMLQKEYPKLVQNVISTTVTETNTNAIVFPDKKTTWNFKIASTPGIEYVIVRAGGDNEFHTGMHHGDGNNYVPIKDVFVYIDEGSIVYDVLPVYGDLGEAGISCFEKSMEMLNGMDLSVFDHTEDTEFPKMYTIDLQYDGKNGMNGIQMNSKVIQIQDTEYKTLKDTYIRKLRMDDEEIEYSSNSIYILRGYDISKASTVELLISEGADISAGDYKLFQVARERYPEVWIWLLDHYKNEIASHMNEIFGDGKIQSIENEFSKNFEEFCKSAIGKDDLDEELELPKHPALLDQFLGFTDKFFKKH